MARWSEISEEQRDRLLELYTAGALEMRHANELEIPLDTLKRRLRDWRSFKKDQIPESASTTWFPDSPSHDWDGYPVIEADDFIVMSDIEIPDHDPAMLQAVLLTAMQHNIKTLVIAGDLLATDNPTLNSWIDTWAINNQINYEGAIGLAATILIKYLDWFERIIVIQGNHDDRISRKTGGEVWFGMLLSEVSSYAAEQAEVVFSRYPYMYIKTSNRGIVYVCHQQNYSVTPVRLGQQIAEKVTGPYYDPRDSHPRVDKCHIILTHTHITQQGFTVDGTREVISLGCMRDPMKTKYMQTAANKYPGWNQSFMYSKGGYFHLLPRHSTNWVEVLGKYFPESEIAVV